MAHPAVPVSAEEGQLSSRRRSPDTESCRWLRALSGTGRERDAAVERLHALLLRAARFEVTRRQHRGAHGGGSSDFDEVAVDAAGDALLAVLDKLHTYRGDSRFTTWAYKFALFEAAAKLRVCQFEGREVPLHDEGWAQLLDGLRAAPDAPAEAAELVGALHDAIAEVLTPHQRAVLVAITLNDVPIDVLAEQQATSRGALYATLHDARGKLRARLVQKGLACV
jgi:RNA polymerase sigma-70 factor (ECF subfamily)